MKTLALALLVPLAICTACGNRDDSSVTTSPSATDEAANTPAPGTGTGTGTGTAGGGTARTGDATSDNSAATPDPAGPPTAHATLTAAAGNPVAGGFTLVNQGSAVSVRGEITGLQAGKEYGFHVHEVGNCALPDFTSAGEHFNPTKDAHGGPNGTARHLGDMPNAKADENGRALISIDVPGVTLRDREGAPNEILGKSIVLHAMPDDYKTQPSGGSGARIACAVIS